MNTPLPQSNGLRIRFWGVRGSCPAPGPETVRHGGNTSCVTVELPNDVVLVLDAGTGMRKLGHELVASGRTDNIHLLLSHTHWDHILGLPFFVPLYLPQGRILLHPLPNKAQERFRRQPALFDPIHFPVPAADVPARIERVEHDSEPWCIGGATVQPIPLNHPGGAQGFRIEHRGRSLCYLTDNELNPPGPVTTTVEQLAAFARHCDVLIHDTQYVHADRAHKVGWGHSFLQDVLELAKQARPKHLVLYHHDPDRSDDALDDVQRQAQAWLDEHAPGIVVSVASEGLTLDLPRTDEG